MHLHRRALRRRSSQPAFWYIYSLSVIFTLNGVMAGSISSSYMGQYVSATAIGTLYTVGSAVSVILFLFISRVLRRLGNRKLTLHLSFLNVMSLLVMGMNFDAATTIIAFVVFLIVGPLLFLNIDIFSETLIGHNETATSSKRGLALSLMKVAAAAAPFIVALVVGSDNSRLPLIYFLSAILFTPFVIQVAINFRSFADPSYQTVRVLDAIRGFWVSHDLRYVFLSQFILQLFFSWTVIYIPLYLTSALHMNWGAVGSILGVGLLGYVIFEYPTGIIADKLIGEKEMMAVGFLILAVTISWISFLDTTSVVAWMTLMFINRVGASFVETNTEGYFFKHTKGTDANIIAFFRLTRPLAILAGSLLGSVSLLYLPFNLIFVVLGAVMVVGIFFTTQLVDTR